MSPGGCPKIIQRLRVRVPPGAHFTFVFCLFWTTCSFFALVSNFMYVVAGQHLIFFFTAFFPPGGWSWW